MYIVETKCLKRMYIVKKNVFSGVAEACGAAGRDSGAAGPEHEAEGKAGGEHRPQGD